MNCEKETLRVIIFIPKWKSQIAQMSLHLQQVLFASPRQLLLLENNSSLPLLWTLTQAGYPLSDKSAWVSLMNLVQRDLNDASSNLIMIL